MSSLHCCNINVVGGKIQQHYFLCSKALDVKSICWMEKRVTPFSIKPETLLHCHQTPLPDSCGLIEFYNSNFYTVVHFSLDLIYLTWLTVVILQVHVPVVDQDLQKRMAGEGLCSSRPWDKGGRGGGGGLKNFSSAFWASVWSKNKGGRQAPLQDPPLCTLHVHNSHG